MLKNALAAIRFSRELAPTIEIITALIREVEFFIKKDMLIWEKFGVQS